MRKLLTGSGALSLCAIAMLFVVLVFALQHLPKGRIDLTEGQLYTLSTGSVNLARQISEPIELDFYFSASISGGLPQLKEYARRIEDLLREYQQLNPDHLQVRVLNPEPFGEVEDQAVAAGLQSAPVTLTGDSLFIGLVATQGDRQQVIPFLNPDRERFLEYDISQLLHRLQHPNPPTIGIVTQLPILGGFDFASQQPSAPWAVMQQMQDVAKIKTLDGAIPSTDLAGVDMLLLALPPEDLDDATLYQIEQFVLSGKPAVIMVDPYAEQMSMEPSVTPPVQVPQHGDNPAGLSGLLAAWGVKYSPQQIVLDREWGLRLSSANGGPPLPHPGIIGVIPPGLNRESALTSELETVNVASSGYLEPITEMGTTFVPLLTASASARVIDAEQYRQTRDHGELLLGYQADAAQPKVLAALIHGQARATLPSQTESAVPYRDQGEIRILVVADTDLLSDRLWVQMTDFYGQSVMMPWANNGDFMANIVDQFAGSADLIELRSRGSYYRPFTRINQLRSEAAEQFKQQEQILMNKLQDLEVRIGELITADEGQDVVGAQSQQAIAEFERERIQTRKELREVQHQLNQTIDELEWTLKLINYLLMPLLLLAVGLAVHLRRLSTRRRGDL